MCQHGKTQETYHFQDTGGVRAAQGCLPMVVYYTQPMEEEASDSGPGSGGKRGRRGGAGPAGPDSRKTMAAK